MGRAEKFANVVDDYETKLKETEKKLSVTRELKFSELQKEIDNTVTIADYEEMDNLINSGSKKEITDTSEIQVEDVEVVEDTSEIVTINENTKEIETISPRKSSKKKKEDTSEVKIIDEPTEELIATDGEESDKDEDDLYLTRSMNPIKRKPKLKKVFKILIVLLIVLVVGLFTFFKVFRPLYWELVNSDPRKVFDKSLDNVSKELKKNFDEYFDSSGVGILSIKTRIDSNIDNFGTDSDVAYAVDYGYDPLNKRLMTNIDIAGGQYTNKFLMENDIVYQKLNTYTSSFNGFIKLDNYTNVLSENEFYKNNKENFDKLQKYISPTEYMYYFNGTISILKDFFEDDMFSRSNYKLERKEFSINVVKNTLTLKNEQLIKINEEINKKVESDAKYKKVYDVFGSMIDTTKNKLVVNIYTRINNKFVGFDIEEDGFTTTYYYLLKNDGTSYDMHFSWNNDKIEINRRDSKVLATVNVNEIEIEANIKEDNDNKLDFDFVLKKDGNTYNGTLYLEKDKGSNKRNFEYKVKNGEKYFNATGSINYKTSKSEINENLDDFIDPPMSEYTAGLENFKNSFSSLELYQKYESWYNLVTNPNPFTFK